MSTSNNTAPDEKKQEPAAEGLKNANEPMPDKIVIPDECGDSLWNDVLAQQPDLSEIIKKPATRDSEKGTGSQQ